MSECADCEVEKELYGCESCFDALCATADSLAKQRRQLEAENKRLREALESVVGFYQAYKEQGEMQDRGMYCAMDMLTVAEQALKEVGDE